MTVFENFKTKNIDELVNLFDEYFSFDNSLWWKWWDENYCSKCEAEIFTDDEGVERDCAYCELNGKCRFFKYMDEIPNNRQTIKMWLESESK